MARSNGLNTVVRANTSLAVNGVRGAGLVGTPRRTQRSTTSVPTLSRRALAKQHKAQVQALAKAIWKSTPKMTIEDMLMQPGIIEIESIYSDRKTVRRWLSEVDPRDPSTKRGRRKRKR
jgi:hypothetical protein